MDWTTIKKQVYFEDGSLRDIYVLATNINDWKKWVDLTNEKYEVTFHDDETGDTTNKIDYRIIEECWSNKNRNWIHAHVKLGRVDLHCTFLNDPEIEFDVDPRYFKSIDDHNSFIKYLTDISTTLDKDVLVTDENTKDSELIIVRKSEVNLNCA